MQISFASKNLKRPEELTNLLVGSTFSAGKAPWYSKDSSGVIFAMKHTFVVSGNSERYMDWCI